MVNKLGKADNFNDAIQNRVIRHSLFLEALKTRQAKEILKFVDKDILPALLDQLQTRLARIEAQGFDRGLITTQRLEAMISELTAITSQFKDINTRTQGELFALAQQEVDWQKGVLNAEAGISLNLTTPPPELLRAAVIAKPFDGRTLGQWYDRLADSAQTRLAQDIRRGVAEGQTTPQIIRNIKTGGYIDVTRAQTEAVARTAVSHVSNSAREMLYQENADVIKGVQWVATLDSRTCLSIDTIVNTSIGDKLLSQLKKGDYILGGSRKYKLVTDVMQPLKKHCFKIKLSNGKEIICSKDHRFLMDSNDWIEAQHLSVGQEFRNSL